MVRTSRGSEITQEGFVKPATKAKTGINPFTKEPMTYKAKPARNVVKALPLKSLKEMV
jgi:DNA-binding protein HU-beta